jgi:hypothetical protein
MRVQLHGTGRIGKWRLRNNLDVTYPLKHDWSSEIRRVLTNNIFANLNTPKGFKDYHGLTEHQRRLHFAMTYRKALGSSTLNSDKRRNRIKTLDEYYLIRAHIATDGIAEEVVDIQKVDKGKKKGGHRRNGLCDSSWFCYSSHGFYSSCPSHPMFLFTVFLCRLRCCYMESSILFIFL